ncbi:MAG: ABC transporter substrate-binding protein [Bifidobacteriaceae bacterium]|jgi:peptide/nickel transport system substrate-binding protein|nr:ABC transporter substrate-binding protein [Bifidobacteriaceae bacterium]
MTTLPNRWAAAGLTGLLLVTASACADPKAPADSPTGAAKPTAGGELRVGIGDIPDCIDAALTPYNNHIGRAVVQNLVEQDYETGEIVPWIATSWDISDDARTYTFHLRDDVTFSNGDPLDAQAVKATFDDAIDFRQREGRGVAAGFLTGYESSEAVDDTTFRVTFEVPKAGFLQAASEKALGIIHPSSLGGTYDERCATGVIGSGPFVIDENVPDQHVSIKRREGYTAPSPNAINQGDAYLDKVTLIEIPETGVLTESLLSGELEAIIQPPEVDQERIAAEGFGVIQAVSAGLPNYFFPNVRRGVFQEVAVRQAFQVALDRQSIHDAIYGDTAPIATSPLSSPVPGHVDLSEHLAYDPDKAVSLLERAGWSEIGEDGIRVKGGERLSAVVPFTAESAKPILQLVQSQLAEIGFELAPVQVTAAEQAAYYEGQGTWDLTGPSNYTRADPDALLGGFHPSFAVPGWWTAESVPDLVKILDAESLEPDPKRRQELVTEAQTLLLVQGYSFPINESSRSIAHAPNVHDLTYTRGGWNLFSDTWIDQDA